MSIEFSLNQTPPATAAFDCVIVGAYADGSLTPAGDAIDAASGGRIKALAERGDVAGKTGRTALLHDLPGVAAPRVLVVGLGDASKFGVPQYLKAVGDASDPGNKHAFPYMWGSIGIGYNPEKVKAALGVDKIDSWDAVFKPENIAKLKSCGVSFLDAPTEMIPAALHYLGKPSNSTDKKDLKAAEELFLSIRPSITYFHSSKYISDLANGNICVAVGYSGDLEQSKARAHEAGDKVKLSYVIPKEGAGTFYDMVAIPKDAENVEAAYKFMDFLMQPEVMAGITNAVRFPNGNKAATALVDKEITSDPSIYPPADVKKKLYAIADPGAKAQREITRSWTKIKSGK